MSYIDKTLGDGEQVIYRAGLSIWSLFPSFLVGIFMLGASVLSLRFIDQVGMEMVGIVVFLALAFVGFMLMLGAMAKFYTTELAITDKRVVAKVGIASKIAKTLQIVRCESCELHQSIIGNMLDFGTVEVSAAGDVSVSIGGIDHPIDFQNAFHQQLERLRSAQTS